MGATAVAGTLISLAGITVFTGADFAFTSSFFTGLLTTTDLDFTATGFLATTAFFAGFEAIFFLATGFPAFLAGLAFLARGFFALGLAFTAFFTAFLAAAGFLADFLTGLFNFFFAITSIPTYNISFLRIGGKSRKKSEHHKSCSKSLINLLSRFLQCVNHAQMKKAHFRKPLIIK
ncbi:MAG TPA: hypothetical protein VFJ43_00815 [Bacteroidia bacterium]|nr:hypothetical protein [Bacteroidia bacterium]